MEKIADLKILHGQIIGLLYIHPLIVIIGRIPIYNEHITDTLSSGIVCLRKLKQLGRE